MPLASCSSFQEITTGATGTPCQKKAMKGDKIDSSVMKKF